MPLNYAKWEQIEISDDSDIEGHPNVDKKSLILFYQRTTREKRKERNHRIEQLTNEVAGNEVLLGRLHVIQRKLAQSDLSYFSSEVDRLCTNLPPEAPPTDATNAISYDDLLQKIAKEVHEQAESEKGKLLEERLEFHVNKLKGITEELRKERDALLKEKSEHITMDDLYDGFKSEYVPPKPEPTPAIVKVDRKGTSKTAYAPLTSASTPTARAPDDKYTELPYMTPALEEFAKFPLWGFEKLWQFIQNHCEVVVPGARGALLLAAFWALKEGKSKYAKQCVHRSMVLQYTEDLGNDGVRLFFHYMATGDKRAQYEMNFREDVEHTYACIVDRVEIDEQEQADSGDEEPAIQLEPQDPDVATWFNVPDRPPSEHQVLEGLGTEGLDVKARKALQMRWDIFCGLPENLKEALKTNHLAAVNKVLRHMPHSVAKNAVKALNTGGILSVRGETGSSF